MSRGRPSLYDEAKAIAAADAGGGMDVIADRLGVGRRRLEKWSHRFPAFREAVQRGREADARREARSATYAVDYEAADAMRHQVDELLGELRALPLPEPPPPLVDDPRDAALRAEVQKLPHERPEPRETSEAAPERLGMALEMARARPTSQTIAQSRRQSPGEPAEPAERSPVDADPEDDPQLAAHRRAPRLGEAEALLRRAARPSRRVVILPENMC